MYVIYNERNWQALVKKLYELFIESNLFCLVGPVYWRIGASNCALPNCLKGECSEEVLTKQSSINNGFD